MSQELLLSIAEAVADGGDVDWSLAESSAADEAERAAIRQLRTIAAVRRSTDLLPTDWGPLEIREELGRGTFGTVYRAWDARLQREVALKLLLGTDSATAMSRLTHEGRLMARVTHPNVVTVYGADESNGQVGIWMELIQGDTLKEIVARNGTVPPGDCAAITRDVCRALSAVHAEGILHRDVKAQNVMRDRTGRVLLMDFGAGVLADIVDSPLAGTPLYLAPEVLAGAPQTIQSDVFSAGVLAFHLATGSFPYPAESVSELRAAHRAGRARSLRDVRPDLSSRLAGAIEQALAPDPAARYGSAAAFAEALDAILQPRVPPWLIALRAALMLTGLAAVLSGGLFAASLAGQSGDRERQAFVLYVQGLELARERTATSLTQSLTYYQNALSLQPDFARAHAAMAEAYMAMGVYAALPRRAAHEKASEHAERALALDPELWEVHRSLAYLRKNAFRWSESEASFRTAIAINPTDGQTHHWYSILLTQLGRLDDAASEIAIAQSLLPQSLPARLQHAAILQMRRRYDASIAEYKAVLALLGHTGNSAGDRATPGRQPLCGSFDARALAGSLVTLTRRHLAKTYALSGDYQQAVLQLTALACDSSGGFEDHELQADLGWAVAMAGDEQAALAIVSKLEERFRLAGEQVAASIAAIYTGLNRADEAFLWLDRAVADGDPGAGYLKSDPRWDRLRSDQERLDRLLDKLGLPGNMTRSE